MTRVVVGRMGGGVGEGNVGRWAMGGPRPLSRLTSLTEQNVICLPSQYAALALPTSPLPQHTPCPSPTLRCQLTSLTELSGLLVSPQAFGIDYINIDADRWDAGRLVGS